MGMTVKELATKANRPVQDVLEMIEGAGLAPRSADDEVSVEDRRALAQVLAGRRSVGAVAAERKPAAAQRVGAPGLRTPAPRRGGVRPGRAEVKVRKRRVPAKPAGAQPEEAPEPVAEPPADSRAAADPAAASAETPEPVAEPPPALAAEKPAAAGAKRAAAARSDTGMAVTADAARADAPAKAKPPARRERGRKAPPPRAALRRKPRPDGDELGFSGRRARPDDPLDDLGTLPDRPVRRRASLAAPRQMVAHGFRNPGKAVVREVELPARISVAELSRRVAMKVTDAVRAIKALDESVQAEDVIDRDVATMFVEHLGHKPKAVDESSPEQALKAELDAAERGAESLPRPPVVALMGHVDHGKTSILDHIRKSRVAASEAGGITQRLGAYHVGTPNGALTFLDTPGHSAFAAMRARGSQITDIVVLVVAADDGVMPQTEEAVRHVQAADVPMVVAVNKMDRSDADADRVRNELAKLGVVYDGWGGNTQFVEMSATEGAGFDELLDAVLLQSEIMELSAPRGSPARGVVVEASVDRHRGVVSTVLVQAGTLRVGDVMLSGIEIGRVRSMFSDADPRLREASPSMLVDVLGFGGAPEAGDAFWIVPKERVAREIVAERVAHRRAAAAASTALPGPQSLEEAFGLLEAGQPKTLNLVLKADVRGSVEALRSALEELGNDEVKARVLLSGVGGVSESDVHFASASSAMVVAFNVRADAPTRKLIESVGVDVRYHQLIYEALEDVGLALSGMLGAERREEVVGVAEVREVFRSPDFGQVAGCLVVEGAVRAGQLVRVLRDKAVIFTGEIDSLRRFKDDVKEVPNGTECGIGVKNYLNVQVGDELEAYTVREVTRELP